MPALMLKRSCLVMSGFLGTTAGIMMTSEPSSASLNTFTYRSREETVSMDPVQSDRAKPEDDRSAPSGGVGVEDIGHDGRGPSPSNPRRALERRNRGGDEDQLRLARRRGDGRWRLQRPSIPGLSNARGRGGGGEGGRDSRGGGRWEATTAE
jgi:hypothetical protein